MSDTSDSSSQRDPEPSPGTPGEPGGGDRDEALVAQAASLIKTLKQGVVVTGERVHETIEDAVRRGRMTRKDAHELAAAIVSASRRQTDELRHELELLLERGRARKGRADEDEDESEPGPPWPGYDELTAVEVGKRLAALSATELTAVRGYEAAHAKRKTVLAAVDRRLAR